MYRFFVSTGTYNVPLRQTFVGKALLPQSNVFVILEKTLLMLIQPLYLQIGLYQQLTL